jgi:act minimal PKS acyl carrier protein
MAEFTRADLNRMLREGAGVDEEVDLDGEVLDTPFDELGYDSLALLELCGRVHRELGIVIPDEAVVDMTTPRATLDIVNSFVAV